MSTKFRRPRGALYFLIKFDILNEHLYFWHPTGRRPSRPPTTSLPAGAWRPAAVIFPPGGVPPDAADEFRTRATALARDRARSQVFFRDPKVPRSLNKLSSWPPGRRTLEVPGRPAAIFLPQRPAADFSIGRGSLSFRAGSSGKAARLRPTPRASPAATGVHAGRGACPGLGLRRRRSVAGPWSGRTSSRPTAGPLEPVPREDGGFSPIIQPLFSKLFSPVVRPGRPHRPRLVPTTSAAARPPQRRRASAPPSNLRNV